MNEEGILIAHVATSIERIGAEVDYDNAATLATWLVRHNDKLAELAGRYANNLVTDGTFDDAVQEAVTEIN